MSEKSKHFQRSRVYATFIASLFTITGLILFLLWLMNSLIIGPIKKIADITHLLSNNHLNTPIPNGNATNEIGSIFNALAIFKNNALLQNESADMLIDSNLELQNQLLLIEQQKEEINAQSEEIKRSSQYKSEFIANMSHELRTPLNSVILLSKMLQEEHCDTLDKHSLKSLCYINKAGNTLLSLVNDILDLAKIEAGKMACVNSDVALLSISTFIMDEFKALSAPKNIELSLITSDALPLNIYTDQQRVLQILRNLLSNALKFTDEGNVTLSISQRSPTIALKSHFKTEHWLSFSVADTGIGLTKQQQDVIFNPFKQIDGTLTRRQEGTGLGLTISQNLAKLLGGSIEIDSEINQGATFTLFLPLKNNPARVPALPAVKPVAVSLESSQKINVLFLGDKHSNMDEKITQHFAIDYAKEEKEILALFKMNPQYDFIIFGNHNFQCAHIELIHNCLNDSYVTTLIIFIDNEFNHTHQSLLLRFHQNVSILVRHNPQIMPSSFINTLASLKHSEAYLKNNGLIPSYFKKNKILIVDDNEANVFVIKKLLHKSEVQTFSANCAKTALAVLEEEKNDIDLILMDIMMPHINGFEATRIIRQNPNTASIPIIALTAKAMPSDRIDALMAGANGFVIKPIDAQQLIVAIIRLLSPI